MLLLYMDHCVAGPIAAGLRQRGVDVMTAEEDGTTQLTDELLLGRATALGRVLFSEDKDLLAITHQWQQDGRGFAGLAYAHQLRISIGHAIRDLELLARAFDPEDMRNRVEYLPYS